jgi:STE24 endopeptidase
VTWTKVVLIMTVLACGSATAVALVSRTPASVREGKPGEEARDPSRGAVFSDDDVARHGAYRGPSYLSFVLSTLLSIVLLVLLVRGPFAGLVDRIEGWRGGWVVHAALLALFLSVVVWLVGLPLSFVRGYSIQHAWGLSTQDVTGWFTDQMRALAVGGVIAIVSALAFFALVRWQPRNWWLWGWAGFTVLTVVLVFLYPVVIAPLFNRFTSLEEGALRTRILRLGEEAGVPLDDVLAADASRRTTAENAYVAGLGPTKQMVLFDTLLEAGSEDETVFVAAHELGHRAENYVLKNALISSAGLLLGFALLRWLTGMPGVMAWTGAGSPADLRLLPGLLLFLTVMTLVTLPVQSSVSRAFERQADVAAIRLTEDPDTAVRTFRRLAFSNLADLRPPPPVVWVLFSHPPIPERIDAVMRAPGTP